MKALVYQGDGKISLEDRPVPEIQEPTDAIVKGESCKGNWVLMVVGLE